MVFKITLNRFLKVWDELGYNIYFYHKGDEAHYLEAGYKQLI